MYFETSDLKIHFLMIRRIAKLLLNIPTGRLTLLNINKFSITFLSSAGMVANFGIGKPTNRELAGAEAHVKSQTARI